MSIPIKFILFRCLRYRVFLTGPCHGGEFLPGTGDLAFAKAAGSRLQPAPEAILIRGRDDERGAGMKG